jgi:hypothetical protein
MLRTVLAKVWNVNKKLLFSERTGAFVRQQAACLSSYCLQRYLIGEPKRVTNSLEISVERMCENDICVCCCHFASGRHFVVSQITPCGILVQVSRSTSGPTYLIYWGLGGGGDFPLVKLSGAEADHWSPSSAEVKNEFVLVDSERQVWPNTVKCSVIRLFGFITFNITITCKLDVS